MSELESPEKIAKDIEDNKEALGYEGVNEFLDAYGFSIKQEAAKENAELAKEELAAAKQEVKEAAKAEKEALHDVAVAKKAETKEMVKTTEANAKAELDAWKALMK